MTATKTPLRPWMPGLGGWLPGSYTNTRRSSPVTSCRLSTCTHLAAEEKAQMQRQADEQRAADDGSPMVDPHWVRDDSPATDEDEDLDSPA